MATLGRDPSTGAALPAPREVPALLAGVSGEVGALRRLVADAYGRLHALDKRVGALEPATDDDDDGRRGGFFGGASPAAGGGPPPALAGSAATRAAAAAARFPALADLRRRTGGVRGLRTGAGTLPASGVALEGEVACTAAVAQHGEGGGGGTAAGAALLASVLDAGDSAGPGPPGRAPLPGGPGAVTVALHGGARGGRDAWLALVDVGSGAGGGWWWWGGGGGSGAGGGGGAAAAQAAAPPAAATARLTKASYSWQVTRRGRVTLTPVGGWAGDAAPTLHPPSGVGLSAAARRGCAALAACGGGGGGGGAGSAVSARYRWRDAGVTAARFGGGGGAGGGGGGGATLLQVDGAPAAGVAVGLAAVVGGGRGGGGGGGGGGAAAGAPPPAAPALLPAASSDWTMSDDATSVGPADRHAHHARAHPRARLAALACADVAGGGGRGRATTTLSGWVAADVGGAAAASPAPPPTAQRSWGVTLACPPDRAAPGGLGWALTLSGGSGGGGGSDGSGHATPSPPPPLLAEAGLTVPLGAGSGGGPAGAVFPGVLLVRGAGGRSAALVGVRSSWGF